jgi:hypothetical protein
MNGCAVGSAPHEPVKYVKLANQGALADAANGRVARHLARVFGPKGKETNAGPATRRRRRGLAPGMAGANHQNVVHGAPLQDECST